MTQITTDKTGRCEAMTISEIPPYRCTSEASADRNGHAVCAAHSRTLHKLTFYDDAVVLNG